MLLLGQMDGYFFTGQTSLHQSEFKTSEAELKSSQMLSKEKKNMENQNPNNI